MSDPISIEACVLELMRQGIKTIKSITAVLLIEGSELEVEICIQRMLHSGFARIECEGVPIPDSDGVSVSETKYALTQRGEAKAETLRALVTQFYVVRPPAPSQYGDLSDVANELSDAISHARSMMAAVLCSCDTIMAASTNAKTTLKNIKYGVGTRKNGR
jgi:hypothetical protein